jgi:hypothetical protein
MAEPSPIGKRVDTDTRMDAEAEDEDLEPIDDDEAIPGREPVSLHLSICGDPPQVVVTCNVMGGAASAEEEEEEEEEDEAEVEDEVFVSEEQEDDGDTQPQPDVQTSTAPPQMAKQMAKRTGPTIAEEAAAKEAAAEEEEEEEEDEEVAKAAEAEVAAEAAVAAAAAAEAAEEEAAEAAADLAVAEAAAVQADAEAAEAVEAAEAEAAEAEAEAAEAATAEAAGAEAAEAEVVAEAEAAAAAALRYAKAVPPTPGIVRSDMVEEVVDVLGPRGELHDFKAQAKELYKYESKLTGYSVSKEEEWAKDSPGYYTLQTSGGNQLDRASGGPRFGIPIQEFHWKDERADGAQVVGRVPPVDESPFEVSVCPLRTVLTCSQPDLRAFLVIGV